MVNVKSALDQLSKTQINLKGKAKYTSEKDGEPPFFLILSCTSRRSCRLAFSNCVLIALLASRALTCRRLFSVACWMPMCTCNACLLWKHLCPYHCAPQKWQGWVPAVVQRTNLKFPCAPHPSEHTWCFAPSFARALWQPRLVQGSPSLDTPWHRCTPVLVDMSLGDGPGTILQGCKMWACTPTHTLHSPSRVGLGSRAL